MLPHFAQTLRLDFLSLVARTEHTERLAVDRHTTGNLGSRSDDVDLGSSEAEDFLRVLDAGCGTSDDHDRTGREQSGGNTRQSLTGARGMPEVASFLAGGERNRFLLVVRVEIVDPIVQRAVRTKLGFDLLPVLFGKWGLFPRPGDRGNVRKALGELPHRNQGVLRDGPKAAAVLHPSDLRHFFLELGVLGLVSFVNSKSQSSHGSRHRPLRHSHWFPSSFICRIGGFGVSQGVALSLFALNARGS